MAREKEEEEVVVAQVAEPFVSDQATKPSIKDFIWSEDEWPKLKHNNFDSSEDVPIISLIEVLINGNIIAGQAYDEACRAMVEASEKWGFFKLIDHGVPPEIIREVERQCSELFSLPMEKKLRGGRSKELPFGYINSASDPSYTHNLPWAESIQLIQSPQLVTSFAQRVYDEDQHHAFSDALMEYMEAVEELGRVILGMLAHGLGLSDECFTKCLSEKENMMIRVNQYPPCPLPDKCLGLGSHSDPHTLTILLQDEVGGLQVQKEDGEWIGIKPVPNSFIVNIGDTLDAWTNGSLKSVVHRAVVNKEKKRLSIAYFLSPANKTVVECPGELLDQRGEQRKYKSFTWGEFKRELLIQKRVVKKTALERYLISN
ncbi:hypothetical protein J5N97_018645 [Dioscorea zingiberensis]|uniref:Fe2OG dioxygenase domain-containing protein n=1 Tax=Dioscorea zingiberensis TaxID=325984 RepID=A0A9D5CC98_9LILI|nr:hypothetical protein J5N97_018645 [Dioscorea zingiberensis]